MRLFIVRHGETKENTLSIMQGQIHGTLTRKGILQAKKLARRLKKEKFDAVYCSDLKRTKDTWKEIKKLNPKLNVHYAKELRERSFGVWEGHTHDELDRHVKKRKINFTTWRPKGGETRHQKDRRVLRFYNRMIRLHNDETVLWITHGGPIATILASVQGLNEKQRMKIQSQNTSVNIIEIDNNGNHSVKLVNCVAHL